jgi:hypothetical protein
LRMQSRKGPANTGRREWQKHRKCSEKGSDSSSSRAATGAPAAKWAAAAALAEVTAAPPAAATAAARASAKQARVVTLADRPVARPDLSAAATAALQAVPRFASNS